jgi:hypothetical protein
METTDASAIRDTALKRLTIASIVPLAVMLVACVMKPEWRDEFWTLFITEPNATPPFSLTKLRLDYAHPPLYYSLLHVWRLIDSSEVWARLFSLAALGIGGVAAFRLARGRAEVPWFLLLCAGSYWFIYPATETRSYALVFVLCLLSVLISARALEEPAKRGRWLALWCIVGAALSFTLYFGALWISALGLCLGLSELRRGRMVQFAGWGVAAVIAILPAALWIWGGSSTSLAADAFSDEALARNQLLMGLEQVLRAVVVKQVGSNVALAGAAILGAAVLWRRRENVDAVLLYAVLVALAVAFAVHLLWLPVIKERSLIVLIPALIFLAARAITVLPLESAAARRLLWAGPFVAALTPFAFIPEYFKDREDLVRTVALLKEKGANCAGAQIMVFVRRDKGIFPVAAWTARRTIEAAMPDGAQAPDIADADLRRVDPARTCAIRAVALLLGTRNGPVNKQAEETLRKSGVPLDELVEHNFGKGRQRVYVTR